MSLTTTHKGFCIEYEQDDDTWEVYDDDDNIIIDKQGVSLKEVKKMIDKLDRKTKGPEAKSIPAFILDYYDYSGNAREKTRIMPVKVTSEAGAGEVWVSTGKKHFRKEMTEVYIDNEKNRELVKKIDQYQDEIDALEKDIEGCEERLQRYGQWRTKR